MLAAVQELELGAFVAGLEHFIDEAGRRLVARKGHAPVAHDYRYAWRGRDPRATVNDKRTERDTAERSTFRSTTWHQPRVHDAGR
jgi:hypothetical protein